MIACAPPDQAVGVALRLSGYLDCEARALGENGFQALAGGPVAAGLLSGLVTIFIALIGYRLILGHTPRIGEGVTWAVRLGLVLALVTSWPAFQSLIYRVAVDGPDELAGILLPAAGLPTVSLNNRLQQAYDTIRLGSGSEPSAVAQAPGNEVGSGQVAPLGSGSAQSQPRVGGTGQPPLPQTASLLVISTLGLGEAFRVAIGFLLAVGPLALLGILFDATMGLVTGWVRALAGAALGLLAVTTVTAIELVVVEGELAHLQRYALGLQADTVDPQALTTVVLLFCVVTLLAALAAVRIVGALRFTRPAASQPRAAGRASAAFFPSVAATSAAAHAVGAGRGSADRPPRAAAIADALTQTIVRERGVSDDRFAPPSRQTPVVEAASRTGRGQAVIPLGVAGRRSLARRTRSATLRDLPR